LTLSSFSDELDEAKCRVLSSEGTQELFEGDWTNAEQGHDARGCTSIHTKTSPRARLPFYANMFADAGFPVEPDGSMSDNLIDSLVVSGDEANITSCLTDLLASGLDELIVMPIPVVDPAVELERLIGLIVRL